MAAGWVTPTAHPTCGYLLAGRAGGSPAVARRAKYTDKQEAKVIGEQFIQAYRLPAGEPPALPAVHFIKSVYGRLLTGKYHQ